MSLTPSTQASTSTPTTSLQAALKQFETELTKEQKQSFLQSNRTLTPSDVVVFIAEIDAANQSTRRSVSSRLFTFLDAAQQFVGVVDTFVSSHPTVAALVWGGIKVSLVIANNSLPYFDKVTSMITDVGKLSPTYSEFGKLYQNNRRVQTALCEYYAIIVRICTAVVKLYNRSGLISRFLSSFEAHFQPFLDDLEKAQKQLHVCLHLASQQVISESALKIDKEQKANTLYRQVAARFQSTSLQGQVQTRAALAIQYRQQVLDNLSKLKIRQIWSMIQAQRVGGTAEWFTQQQVFQSWCQSAQTSVLWCSGNMGVGKSVLVSSIIAYLERTHLLNSYISYHFCQTGHEDTLTARGVLGSITRQLLAGCIHQLEGDQLQALLVKSTDLGVGDLIDILELHLEPSSKRSYFIILDGLDDCTETDVATISSQLERILLNTKFCIRLLYGCRPDLEKAISRSLKHHAKLVVTKETTQQDTETFIEFTLQQCIAEEKLKVKDPRLFLRIVKELEENHGGMFLWLSLFIEELCAQNTEADIIDALKRPPEGIKELYSRKLARIRSHQLSKECLDVLQFTGVARRPLRIEEMREALSVEVDSREFDLKRLPNDMDRIVRACSGLIHVDEGTELLCYVHSSLHHYLFEQSTDQIQGFDYDKVNLHFSSICLTYLNYQNFTKQLIRAPTNKPHFEPLDIALAQFPSSKVLSSKLARKLLRLRKSGASVDSKLLHSLIQDESPSAPFHFDFFEYASENWLQQIRNLVPVEMPDFWKRLDRCIENQNLNEWKPWLAINVDDDKWVSWWPIAKGTERAATEAEKATLWALANENSALVFHQTIYGVDHMYNILKKRIIDYAVGLGGDFADAAVRNCVKTRGMAKYMSDKLEKSIDEHNIDMVRVLLATRAHVNAVDRHILSGWSLSIHQVLEDEHLELLKMLLDAGADPKVTDIRGSTPLHKASSRGDSEVVKVLLTAGADFNLTVSGQGTPLNNASGNGHLEVVKILLAAGAHINIIDTLFESTSLHRATEGGYLEVIETLLAAGADINATNKAGSTPLHRASIYKHLEVVKVLLTAGVDINATDKAGSTPLKQASHFGHLEIVKMLLGAGADIETTKQHGQEPLVTAAIAGGLQVVNMLLAAGANVNAADTKDGRIALHVASSKGELDIVIALLANGSNVNTTDKDRRTPLHYASCNGHLEIVEKLLKAGANLDAPDTAGMTPLHQASHRGKLDTVKFLIMAGADVDAVAMNEDTPLHGAAREGYLEVVKALLAAGAHDNLVDGGDRTAQR